MSAAPKSLDLSQIDCLSDSSMTLDNKQVAFIQSYMEQQKSLSATEQAQQKPALKLSFSDEPQNLESDKSDSVMAFRLFTGKTHTTFFSADTYIEQPMEANQDSYATISTIGMGTKLNGQWLIELSAVKDVMELPNSKNSSTYSSPAPDGILFHLSKGF